MTENEQPDDPGQAKGPPWEPPKRSDQRPGEEVVQVNDPYAGGSPPEDDEPESDQHPTGG